MSHPRPRRAMPAPLAVRVGRVAGPILLAGVAAAGIAVAAWPAESQIATPATSAVPLVAPISVSPVVDVAPTPSAPPAASVRPSTSPSKSAAEPAKPKASTTASAKPKPKPTAKAKAKATPSAAPSPKLKVTDTKYATIALNVRVEPAQDAKVVAEIKAGEKVSVTDAVEDGYRFISHDGKGRWVKKQYLVDDKASVAAASGISTQSCGKSSGVESGLTPDAVKVYRAVCARFPQVKSFGGRRGGGGNHGSGRAIDAMTGPSDGHAIASWVRSNAKRLGVSEVIYARKIWTVQRSGDGWRSMSDRGSRTANHYDHVHVSVYGNRATG